MGSAVECILLVALAATPVRPTAAQRADDARLTAGPAAPVGNTSRVILDEQHAVLDAANATTGQPPVLHFTVRANSRLPVLVNAVEVGVIFAADGAALRHIDPGALYQADATTARIGVLRRRLLVQLPPGGQVAMQIDAHLAGPHPQPRVFVTHVLGYGLQTITAPLLLDLLDTDAAADEAAAVDALGLGANAATQRRVRQRWGGDVALVQSLSQVVTAPAPPQPTEQQTNHRVFAVQALAVLGGEGAAHALHAAEAEPRLAAFDEALQVLLVARLTTSRLESPLAFTLPLSIRTMHDLVALSLARLASLARRPSSVSDVAAPGRPPAATTRAAPTRRGRWIAIAILGAVFLFGVGLLVSRRRHSR